MFKQKFLFCNNLNLIRSFKQNSKEKAIKYCSHFPALQFILRSTHPVRCCVEIWNHRTFQRMETFCNLSIPKMRLFKFQNHCACTENYLWVHFNRENKQPARLRITTLTDEVTAVDSFHATPRSFRRKWKYVRGALLSLHSGAELMVFGLAVRHKRGERYMGFYICTYKKTG